jgi:hypothetical protein
MTPSLFNFVMSSLTRSENKSVDCYAKLSPNAFAKKVSRFEVSAKTYLARGWREVADGSSMLIFSPC